MAKNPTELVEKLGDSYRKILPLLNYLKVRLKYDTVRWIRTYGTKDDIVFSTRVKTFERTYDKLIRKATPLNARTEVLNVALSEKRILDDLIGIRFIWPAPGLVDTRLS
jgi:ppGpp synthetase/RelA/SpoT-type nucleotidyltranferase